MNGALAHARPAFWLMLLLALVGCVGMRLLASMQHGDKDDDVQLAIYRYPADAMPDCEKLLGLAARPEPGEDPGAPDAVWVRLQVSPLKRFAAFTS